MFGWIVAGFWLLICLAVQQWWDRHVPKRYRYHPVRKWRTSRTWMFLKAWLVVTMPESARNIPSMPTIFPASPRSLGTNR